MHEKIFAVWNIYTKELEILSEDVKELSDVTGLNEEVFNTMLEDDMYILNDYKIHCRDSSKTYYSNKDRMNLILNKYVSIEALEDMVGLNIFFRYSNDGLSFTENEGMIKGDYVGIYLSTKNKPSRKFEDYEWTYMGDRNIFL